MSALDRICKAIDVFVPFKKTCYNKYDKTLNGMRECRQCGEYTACVFNTLCHINR